jgi:uncharacterized protein YecT (DUF1311 family)
MRIRQRFTEGDASRRGTSLLPSLGASIRSNLSIDTDPQQQEAASPLMLVVRSFLRYVSRGVGMLVLGATLLVGTTHADAAEQPEFSPAYAQCLDKAGAVDPAVLECMSAEWAVQDRRLNASYKAIVAKLSPERKKRLQEAQRNWLKFVEANCGFYYDPDGGTSARQLANECEIRARSHRASELDELRKWQ